MSTPVSSTHETLERQAARRAEAKAQLLLALRAQGIQNTALLRAMEIMPRDIFVSFRYADLASRDVALPLMCGQTIEAPSQMARMLAALKVERGHRTLEVGTGSGYSAAVLSQLASEVITFDCFQHLAQDARTRLERLNIANVQALWGDGLESGSAFGPFDRILAHGRVSEPPLLLLKSLSEQGILVFPQEIDGSCRLMAYRRLGHAYESSDYGPCHAQALLTGRFGAF